MSEVKIVIVLKDDKPMWIGMQSPDCDPVFRLFEGELKQALDAVPGLLEEANKKWDENPRNPKYTSPLPSEEEAKTTGRTAVATRPASKPKQDQTQMF